MERLRRRILRPETEAWTRDLAKEKPQKIGRPRPLADTAPPERAEGVTRPKEDKPQAATQAEHRRESPHKIFPERRLDQATGQVAAHAELHRMEKDGNRSHHTGEDQRSRGEPKTKSLELVHEATRHKEEKRARLRVDGNQEASLPEGDGSQPGPGRTKRRTNWMMSNLKSRTST